jgi:hypothetical protein
VQQSPETGMDPIKMLMHAADRIGNGVVAALDSMVGLVAEHAPSAVASSCAMGVREINEAARDSFGSLGACSEPAASANIFAGLDLGDALGGLKNCGISPNGMSYDVAESGQLPTQFSAMSMQRSGAFLAA